MGNKTSSRNVNRAPSLSLIKDHKGRELLEEHKYEEAYSCFQSELDILTNTKFSHQEIALCYNYMADCLFHLRRLDEALIFYQSALKKTRQFEFAKPKIEGKILSQIGRIYMFQSKPHLAAKYLDAGFKAYRSIGGPDQQLVEMAFDAGKAFDEIRNFLMAYQYYKLTIDLQNETIVSDELTHGIQYNKLAMTALLLKNYPEALEVSILARDCLMSQRPVDLVDTFLIMGLAYKNLEKYSEATDCIREAMDFIIEKLNPKHSDMASCYNNLGVIMQTQGRNQEAIRYFERAMQIWEETDPESPGEAISCYNMGSLMLRMQRVDESFLYFSRSVELRKKLCRQQYPVRRELMTAIEKLPVNYKKKIF